MFRTSVMILLLLLGLLAQTHSARAGAWARPEGEVFLSYSYSLSADLEALNLGVAETQLYRSAYGELGLGNGLTFGLDLGVDQYTQETVGFLRYTITAPERPLQIAFDLGLGRREVEVIGDSDLLRLGASLGYGFPPEWAARLPFASAGGWAALDATAIYDLTRNEMRWKLETTLGLSASNQRHFLLQLVTEQWPGHDIAFGINPSVAFRVFRGASLDLGLRAAYNGRVRVGLELGLWQEF